jgi:hypothetical protein
MHGIILCPPHMSLWVGASLSTRVILNLIIIRMWDIQSNLVRSKPWPLLLWCVIAVLEETNFLYSKFKLNQLQDILIVLVVHFLTLRSKVVTCWIRDVLGMKANVILWYVTHVVCRKLSPFWVTQLPSSCVCSGKFLLDYTASHLRWYSSLHAYLCMKSHCLPHVL